MNQLIAIKDSNINGELVQTVNARELHRYLESQQHFADWIKSRFEQYGFIENRDYVVHKILTQYNQVDRIDFHISINMAKELAMVERNEKGKQARQYFIECERKLKAQPAFKLPTDLEIARRYVAALEDRDRLQAQITEQAPKVEAFDTFLSAKNSQTMNEVSKALDIGRNKLFAALREKQILMFGNNLPFQRYISAGYFKVREMTIKNGDETITQTLVTAKGIEFIRKVLKHNIELIPA